MLEIGSTLGGMYQVLHDVGRGGTSHVYLVLNARAGRQWAAKEIAKDGGGEAGVINRGLITDVEVLKKLSHPGIPSIVDVLETEDHYYILMDYIEGVTLERVLRMEGEQEQDKVVQWAIQLCDVFTYLHTQDPKIIYRDTKPSNIMLKPDGNVVLIDFGAAREYKPMNVEDTNNLGTRGYAAPEQNTNSGQTDERTDIYNLGVTLYHLLTGHNPNQYPYDIYPIRHWNKDLSSGLEQIILRCTKANPEERYQSAADLKHDLMHYTDLDLGNIRKRRMKLIGSGICGALGVACLVGSIVTHNEAIRIRNNNYENLLKTAEYAATKEEQIELYTKAIQLNPEKMAAYEGLLNRCFLEDNVLDSNESSILGQLLGTTTGQKTYDQILSESKEYASFAYDLGLTYYYYYEGGGNKPMSEPWLNIAANSEKLSNAQKERAVRLAKIASYYTKLGQRNLAGDSEMSYADYWNDLDSLTKDNIVNADNAKTAYVTYQECTYQMRMHADEFKKAGISEEQMLAKAEEIEEHLKTDFSAQDEESNEDTVKNIKENLKEAKTSIQIAFHGQEG